MTNVFSLSGFASVVVPTSAPPSAFQIRGIAVPVLHRAVEDRLEAGVILEVERLRAAAAAASAPPAPAGRGCPAALAGRPAPGLLALAPRGPPRPAARPSHQATDGLEMHHVVGLSFDCSALYAFVALLPYSLIAVSRPVPSATFSHLPLFADLSTASVT